MVTQEQIEVVQQQWAQIGQTWQKGQRFLAIARIKIPVGTEIRNLPDEYVEGLVAKYREIKAVLKAQVEALP